MPRTPAQIAQAAAEAEAWLDSLDPDTTPADDPADLRAVSAAQFDVVAATERLHQAVHVARAGGRSWGLIGMALGISKQAAQKRFGEPRVADGAGTVQLR